MEDLQRDWTAMPEVVGEEDHRHATVSKLALEAIAVRESGLELVKKIGHEGQLTAERRVEGRGGVRLSAYPLHHPARGTVTGISGGLALVVVGLA